MFLGSVPPTFEIKSAGRLQPSQNERDEPADGSL
jgi:hypothetical protein